ncbi:hypothetical protein [Dysgonomonas sp. 520]|nr:hypothetical protein [Dysgonomonas sp. 520]
MLSTNECKKILEENKEQFTDAEIEQIREFLYKMAKVVIDNGNKEEDKL